MPRSQLDQIRDCIRQSLYDMTAHAMEEMAEDLLDILDIESAILSSTLSDWRSPGRGLSKALLTLGHLYWRGLVARPEC